MSNNNSEEVDRLRIFFVYSIINLWCGISLQVRSNYTFWNDSNLLLEVVRREFLILAFTYKVQGEVSVELYQH